MQKLKLILLSFSILFLLTGCFQKREVEDLAYVIAIGIDKGDKEPFKFTFQIAVPVKIVNDGNNGKDTTSLISIESNTFYNAISKANAMISKEITLSHNKVIIFSEELAKDDNTKLITAFVKNKEVRPKNNIIVYKGKSIDFLSNLNLVLEKNPTRYYDLILNSSKYTGYSIANDLFDFYLSSYDNFSSPFTVLAEEIKQKESGDKKETLSKTANVTGIALFKDGKMVGEIKEDLIISQLILQNKLKKVNIEIPDIQNANEKSVINIVQREKPKVDLKIINNIPNIKINIKLHAQLLNSANPIDYSKTINRKKLKSIIENKLEKDMNIYLNKISKVYKTDPIGFGKYCRLNVLTLKELSKINWINIFPKTKFELNFDIYLDTTQIISNRKDQ